METGLCNSKGHKKIATHRRELILILDPDVNIDKLTVRFHCNKADSMFVLASFPVPRPAFHRLQYGKAGRAWYISSHEHDVIDKWQKISERGRYILLVIHIQRSVRTTVVPC